MAGAAEVGQVNSLWTVEQVATFLGVKPSWVYERTADKVRRGLVPIPHFKLSARTLRFDPAAIRQWAENRQASAGPRREQAPVGASR